MEKIPSLKIICDLLEEKPGAWETVKPFVKLALLVAPGTVFSSFGTAAGTLAALGNGATLADALDKVEGGLFRTKSFLWRKRPDYESPFDRPRMANALLIFAAWFDTLADEEPALWENLKLDEQGFNWIQKQGQEEYRKVLELVGDDGRAVLLPEGRGMLALKELYIQLKEQTKKLAQGLVKTKNLRVDWDCCPESAVVRYRRYYDILQKYDSYRKWSGQQFHEEILSGVEDVKEGQQEILQELRKGSTSEQPVKLNLPPKSSLYEKGLFRGREAELERIRAAFQNQKTVILTGLGGMGKTELAVRFGREWANQDGVYFLTFRETFRETMALGVTEGMSQLIGQKLDPDAAYALAMKRLSECTKEELLILDNVDVSQESLSSVIGKLSGLTLRSIVTTRCEMAGAIDVDYLPVEELVQIFDDHKAPVDMEKRLELIQVVDRHTLTVDLIARSLKGGRVKADTILEALKEQNLSKAMLPPVDADFPGAQKQEKIYGHLRTVFRVTGMSQPEQEAMRAAVLLPQSGMDAELFQNALSEKARAAMFSLAENGWLSWQDGLVAIHPVIRLVCREELKPTDVRCETFLFSLLDQHDPTQYNKIRLSQMAELFSIAANNLDDNEGIWANRAGQFLYDLGEFRAALDYNMRAVSRMENCIEEKPLSLAAAYNNLGMTYGDMGNHEEALVFKQKALSMWENALPSGHPSLATAYSNLGMTYTAIGEHETALEYQLKALSIKEHTLEPNDPSLAIAYNNIGSAYGELGKYEEEIEYQLKAISIRRRVLSAEHPLLAASYNNVGLAYFNLGDYEKALEYLIKAMIIREHSLPSQHTDIAKSYNSVGEVYHKQGNYDTALDYQLKALRIFESALPFNKLDLATSYYNLGGTYIDLEDYDTALVFFLKTVGIWEEKLPSDHHMLATIYSNIGGVYNRLENHEKALEYKLKALEKQEKTVPPEELNLAKLCNDVGVSYYDLGDYKSAVAYLKKSMFIRERVLVCNDLDLAESYNNIGLAYGRMGKHKEALEYLQKTLTVNEKNYPPNHPVITESYNNIVVTLLQMSKFSTAVGYIERQVQIAEAFLPEGHPDLEYYRKGQKVLEHYAELQKKGIGFMNPFLNKEF